MTKARFTLACTSTDRTRPILDGRIAVPGCEFICLPGEPEDIFRRALRDKAFDITELSMSSHIVTTARGDSSYIGIPVFPSRAFRHSGIYIRTDRGIRSPVDLKGKRIGLPEFQQTAALWVRGMFADEYGVATRDISWVTGGMEQMGGSERIALSLPPELDVKPIGPSDTLNGLLASGEIDAVISPRPPSCYDRKTAPVDRLFGDYRSAEMAYAKQTGFFPIMHCLAVRRDVADAYPWLPLELFRAFAQAKKQALDELSLVNVLRISSPWVASAHADAKQVLGDNPWPYGFAANRTEIAAMIRYARADGLAARDLDPAELFHKSTLEAPDLA